MRVYICGVMATQLFSTAVSLFQIMTGDDWVNVIEPITDELPWSWLFFLIYVLLASFIVLNLFIAVAVEALDQLNDHKGTRD